MNTVGRYLVHARHFSTKSVGVIGAGLMGHGIAQVSAQGGYSVTVFEYKQGALDTGMKRIDDSLSKLAAKQVKKGTITDATQWTNDIRARISSTTKLEDLANCDLVIEAIVEDVDIKTSLYKTLGEVTKPSAILASNTSSLPIRVMADASNRASHTVGLHFFNPVQLMQLVEVVRTDKTDQAVLDACNDYVKTIKKSAVACKDTPGFIVNRLLVPYIASAIAMLERGDATVVDIDTAMRLGAGHPMGPITLADYVGLDTCLFVLKGWKKNYPDEQSFNYPRILEEKVNAGHLGRKSGQGFYKWDGDVCAGPV